MNKTEQAAFAALQAENETLKSKIRDFERIKREVQEASECIYNGFLDVPEGTKVVFNNIEVVWTDKQLTVWTLHDNLLIMPMSRQKIVIQTTS